MPQGKRRSLVKPTLDTPFHIDFSWWQAHTRDWRFYMHRLLCAEHQKQFEDWKETTPVDWVDPETAEVHPVDGMQYVLMTHCAQQPEFLDAHVPLVDAIFRMLIANGNRPMTPVELAERLNRPAQARTILRTLTGKRDYLGIRPVEE
ncbi:MAG TPA: hypothetical protein ENJ54_09260 [Chloroflexi bacterium]|nr:hypothetical protein [Chloroflexota bacterium]